MNFLFFLKCQSILKLFTCEHFDRRLSALLTYINEMCRFVPREVVTEKITKQNLSRTTLFASESRMHLKANCLLALLTFEKVTN